MQFGSPSLVFNMLLLFRANLNDVLKSRGRLQLGLAGLPQGKTKVSSHYSRNTLLLTGPAWTQSLARNTLRCSSSSTALLGLPVALQTSRAQLLSEAGPTSTDICLLHSADVCFIAGSRLREEG